MNTNLLTHSISQRDTFVKNLGRKLACFFALTLFFINTSKALTNVHGGIYHNTTWTLGGSPYIVTDTVVIFQGITLNIEPGVVVKFDSNVPFFVYGNLIANGTPSDSIIFTSNSPTPYAGIYSGIEYYGDSSSCRYCKFSYAYVGISDWAGIIPVSHCSFLSNRVGISAYVQSIDTCTFKYDSVGISLTYWQGNVIGCDFMQNGTGIDQSEGIVKNCTFRNNNYGIQGSYFGPYYGTITHCTFDSNRVCGINDEGDSVRNCTIKYNRVGISSQYGYIIENNISDNYIGIETLDDQLISCNTICSNTTYNIVMENTYINQYVKENYWCLNDSVHIQATIYDGHQDILLGLVYFTPFDTVPCVQLINNFSVSMLPLPAKLCWNSPKDTLIGSPAGGYFYGNGVIGNSFYPSQAGGGKQVITYMNFHNNGVYYAYDTVFVEGPNSPPGICYVTTDTSSAFNTVIWQKPGMDTLAIDSVIVYRQNVLSQYVPIGKVSVHGPTLYKDYTARPLVEAYFYQLGVKDSCSGDTLMDNANETVFLQASPGGVHVENLDWNFYEGSPVSYYRILRDDSGNGNWHLIDSVQSSLNAYSDRNAPSALGLRYMVNTAWNVHCTPTLHHPQLHSSHYVFEPDEAYSNVTHAYPTGVNAISALNNSLTLFPNPVNSVLSITINQSFSGSVTITDVLGQEVYPKGIHSDSNTQFTSQKGNTEEIDMSGLRSGVYIISIQSGDAVVRRKIIKI